MWFGVGEWAQLRGAEPHSRPARRPRHRETRDRSVIQKGRFTLFILNGTFQTTYHYTNVHI